MTDNTNNKENENKHVGNLATATDSTAKDPSVLAKMDSNEKNSKPDSASPATHPSNTNSGGIMARIPWLASLAIIMVIVVGMISLQNGQQTSQLQNMQQKATDLDQQLLKEQQNFEQQLASIQSSLQSNQSQNSSQLEKLQSDLASAQQDRFDLEEKIKQVSLQASAKGRDPVKWRIAEIEYLLSLANHRLVLSQDHNTALTALNDADKRLRTIADPGLSQIRLSIANEIKSLQSVQVPDIAGMAMKLSALVEGISQLPLVNTERKLARQESGIGEEVESWEQIPAAIWRDIKGLVTVRRSNMSIEPILPPDELHYLSQNLGLKIEQARLALLRKDTALFRSNLKDTGLWVSRYFDHDTAPVTHVIDTINTLMAADVVTTMPDISGSLRQLRRWRDIQETALFITPTTIKDTPIKSGSIQPQSIEPKTISEKTITEQSNAPQKAETKISILPKPLIKKTTPPPAAPGPLDSDETESLGSIQSIPEKDATEVVLIPSEPAESNTENPVTDNSEITPAQEMGLTAQTESLEPTSDLGLSSATTSDTPGTDNSFTTINSEADLSTATQTTVDAVSSQKEVAP